MLGRILQGADFPGFLGNLDALYDRADVEGTAWRALIAAWWEKHQKEAQLAGDLFPWSPRWTPMSLSAAKTKPDASNPFGKALARALDRVFSIETGGTTLRLQVADGGSKQRARLWQLAPVDKVSVVSVVSFSPPHARENNSSSSELRENSQYSQYSPDGVVEESLPDDLSSVGAAAFTPSEEWQEVPDGAALPPGCEIRMDFKSGKNYARLMPQEDMY